MLQAQVQTISDKDAALEAARAAEQQLRKQLASASSSSTSAREAHAEAESLRQQLEESVRKYSTAKQARERAMSEVSRIHGSQCGMPWGNEYILASLNPVPCVAMPKCLFLKCITVSW